MFFLSLPESSKAIKQLKNPFLEKIATHSVSTGKTAGSSPLVTERNSRRTWTFSGLQAVRPDYRHTRGILEPNPHLSAGQQVLAIATCGPLTHLTLSFQQDDCGAVTSADIAAILILHFNGPLKLFVCSRKSYFFYSLFPSPTC